MMIILVGCGTSLATMYPPKRCFFDDILVFRGVKSTFRGPFVLYEVFVNGPSLPPGPREDPAM